MVNVRDGSPQEAPGALERVRELLNTWLIPNDTRRPADRFDDYAAPLPAPDRDVLRRLRDDLRAAVERQPGSDDLINAWVHDLGLGVRVHDRTLVFRHDAGTAGEILAIVLEAITTRQWDRLKACPDCRWVFYDHTRNASKRWCLMNAGGPGGRACGTIAKVRRHRRNRAGRDPGGQLSR
ncbi:CGNR zinc finger domain-containing protein [Nonomuraea terrae]|uniref:CGNR zinc finger domain-containing protein n=1 Tax=Nonomuraea terrae TaxID=2530383 RepID=A0A4R4XV33_9ACTN|nr:CGNR zinc finger domain-containing protein [Nonomuraea terrae]TDD34442.1 CGNR zinc finger domain-containing protein [Nonomuraea terrae]